MGGGAAMRAVAKITGIGVVNGGLRGVPAINPAEHPFTSAARKVTRPVSAIISSSDTTIDAVASVQRPYWEIGDWELAGGEEELRIDSGEPMPRLVFGGAPNLQEAKEATSELTDALDKAYLSPDSTGGSFISDPQHGLLVHSNSDHLETKACVTNETIASVPKHAIQAFRFLNESSAAQSVVASIASDPNVWNAVMQNEALVEFLHSQKSSISFSDMDINVKESAADADLQSHQSIKCFDDESCNSEENTSGNGFEDFFQNIKVTVVEMMNSLSGYFQNIFGGPEVADGSAKTTFVDRAMGAPFMAPFMGLAVMVIIVVVLKRG